MTVGVIVPVRSPSPWLGEALESVLSQDPAPDGVLVIDDGSEPPLELPDVAEGRVELLRHERSRGPAAARDTGLERLGTDFVALADHDDVWESGKLAAQLAAFRLHPEADVCFGRAEVIGPDGRATGESWEELPAGLLEPAVLGPRLYELSPVPASSLVIRRDAIAAVGGFASPTPLASDWELLLRLVAHGSSFVFEPKARVRYRRHTGGISRDVAGIAESQIAIRELHAELAPEDVRRRVRARDLVGLARGRVRQRRYAEARALLTEADELEPLGGRERALRALLAVPGVRGALGRRDPYR
jgi:glycosyltransferase involved in cell wall biosynthesis